MQRFDKLNAEYAAVNHVRSLAAVTCLLTYILRCLSLPQQA